VTTVITKIAYNALSV